MTLAGHLKIAHRTENRVSTIEITSGRQDIGFGIYDLCGFHSDLQIVLDELAQFVGSTVRCETFGGMIPLDVVLGLRESFDAHRGDAGLRIVDETPAIRILHQVYADLDQRLDENNLKGPGLERLYQNLRRAFSSSATLRGYLLSGDSVDDWRTLRSFNHELFEQYYASWSAYRGTIRPDGSV